MTQHNLLGRRCTFRTSRWEPFDPPPAPPKHWWSHRPATGEWTHYFGEGEIVAFDKGQLAVRELEDGSLHHVYMRQVRIVD